MIEEMIHTDNVKKGFYDDDYRIYARIEQGILLRDEDLQHIKNQSRITRLAMIISEISEAIEAIRKNKYANRYRYESGTDTFNKVLFEQYIKDTFEDELADVYIRLKDFLGAESIDLDWHVEQKLEFNKTRPYKHGKEL